MILKILGVFILLVVFSAIFIAIAAVHGVIIATLAFGIAIIMAFMILLGVFLILR